MEHAILMYAPYGDVSIIDLLAREVLPAFGGGIGRVSSSPRFALGFDFGTESGRAVLFDVANGRLVSSAIHPYSNGVIDERLPAVGPNARTRLGAAGPRRLPRRTPRCRSPWVQDAGVDAVDIIGVGIDFTACTMLPTTADGTPLLHAPAMARRAECLGQALEASRRAALCRSDQQGCGDRTSGLLARHGGRYSSEWFWSKVLQTVNEAPEVHAAAERYIEAWTGWSGNSPAWNDGCLCGGLQGAWDPKKVSPTSSWRASPEPRGHRRTRMQRDLDPSASEPAGSPMSGQRHSACCPTPRSPSRRSTRTHRCRRRASPSQVAWS